MLNRDFGSLAGRWRDLEATGVPLEPLEYRVGVDARMLGSGLTIRRVRSAWMSEIRGLKNGRFAYILPVFVRRDSPGKTTIVDYWLSPPWMDTQIEFLEDPTEEGRHPAWYSFPGDSERFPRENVLNHRLNRTLGRGDICQGLLLAIGSCLPAAFENNDDVTIKMFIEDQWDIEHPAQLQMRLNRLPPRVQEISKTTRGPLLSKRDFIAPSRSPNRNSMPTRETREEV